jgi:hypothetical protein
MTWQLMSAAEIHQFGIESILPYLQKEGVNVENVSVKSDENPQVVGTYHGSKAFVFVRTAMYPQKGQLTISEVQRCMVWAQQHNALALFASVGLACTNYPDRSEVKGDGEMQKPIKNAGFAVSYQGLAALGGH